MSKQQEQQLLKRHKALLREILKHQIANQGTEFEFYRCYTYPSGEMPKWVAKAKALLKC